MTNDKYAVAVAEIMGWKPNPEGYEFPHYRWDYSNGNPTMFCDYEFNPATDWASAGVWIEWLADRCFAITLNKSINCKIAISTIEKTHCGFANTPLKALKNASEKFIEARNE